MSSHCTQGGPRREKWVRLPGSTTDCYSDSQLPLWVLVSHLIRSRVGAGLARVRASTEPWGLSLWTRTGGPYLGLRGGGTVAGGGTAWEGRKDSQRGLGRAGQPPDSTPHSAIITGKEENWPQA